MAKPERLAALASTNNTLADVVVRLRGLTVPSWGASSEEDDEVVAAKELAEMALARLQKAMTLHVRQSVTKKPVER